MGNSRRTTPQTRSRAIELRKRMTASELVIWEAVRSGRLGCRFRRQEPIGPYIVDFVCAEHMLVVEADGTQHEHSDHDFRRDIYLGSLGYRVLRFRNEDVARYPKWVVKEIRQALRWKPLYPSGSAAAVPPPQRGD